jgi:hypothetical protein
MWRLSHCAIEPAALVNHKKTSAEEKGDDLPAVLPQSDLGLGFPLILPDSNFIALPNWQQ